MNDQRPRLLAVGVLASSIIVLTAGGLSFMDQVFFPSNTIRYLAQTMDECQRDGEYCRAMSKINRDAESGDRVYVASYQHYWLRGDLLQCANNQNDRLSPASTGEQMWLELYQNGFKYILIDESTHGFIVDRLNLDHIPEWVKLKLEYNTMPLSVYEMKFDNPPATAQPAFCQRLPSSKTWEVVFP